ncbi:MAG: hypothetical protein HUJ31_18420 [Pseudomonadales bacterium]|nr:hypothetical protein [Pseudomonadales bacterium]
MLEFILFLLGIHLMMAIIAGAYRIIDLWYRISDFTVSIAVRLLIPLVLTGILLTWLEGSDFRAFAAGLIGFAGFHIAIFWIVRLVLILGRNP